MRALVNEPVIVALEGPVLAANGLSKEYGKGAALVRAVEAASLVVMTGESIAMVGPQRLGK